jgi:AGZA family xanthine/uracil permease-like MFS transporter
MLPPTCSIAHGIAFGFIAYVGIKALAGCVWDIHPAAAISAILFVCKFALICPHGGHAILRDSPVIPR